MSLEEAQVEYDLGDEDVMAGVRGRSTHRFGFTDGTGAGGVAVDTSFHRSQNMLTECTGGRVEWHVVLPRSLQHCSFELVPWLHHSIILLLSAFSLAWFNAIGSVSNPMSDDSVEQPIVEAAAAR